MTNWWVAEGDAFALTEDSPKTLEIRATDDMVPGFVLVAWFYKVENSSLGKW